MPATLSSSSTTVELEKVAPSYTSIGYERGATGSKISTQPSGAISGPRGGNSNANTAASSTDNNADGSWRSDSNIDKQSSFAPVAGQAFPGFHRKNLQAQQQRSDLNSYSQSGGNNYPEKLADENTDYSPQFSGNNTSYPARYTNRPQQTRLAPQQQRYTQPPSGSDRRVPLIPRENYGLIAPRQQWGDADDYYTNYPQRFHGPPRGGARPGIAAFRGEQLENFAACPWNKQQEEAHLFDQQTERAGFTGHPGPQQIYSNYSNSRNFYPNVLNPQQQYHQQHGFHDFSTSDFGNKLHHPHAGRGGANNQQPLLTRPSLYQDSNYLPAGPATPSQRSPQQQQWPPFAIKPSHDQPPPVRRIVLDNREKNQSHAVEPPQSVANNFHVRPFAAAGIVSGDTIKYPGQNKLKVDQSYPPLQREQQQHIEDVREPAWPHQQRKLSPGRPVQHVISGIDRQLNPQSTNPPEYRNTPTTSNVVLSRPSTAVEPTRASPSPSSIVANKTNGSAVKNSFAVSKSGGFLNRVSASPPANRPATSASPALAKTAALYRAPRGRSDANAGGVLRQFRAALNKLAPDNFERLTQECVGSLRSKATESILKDVIDLIYEKALSEHKYSSLYAGLCSRLDKALPNFDAPSQEITTFKRLLLEKVQKTFLNRAQYFSQQTLSATEDAHEAAMKMKEKQLNNMKFIGELGKIDLLTPGILLMCIEHLLLNDAESVETNDKENSLVPRDNNSRADDLECLCQILKIVGKLLYNNADARVHRKMDFCMESLRRASRNRMIEPRVRFFCLDIVELHENKWIPKRMHQNQRLKTLREVRQEADREAAAAQEASNAAIRAQPNLLLKHGTSGNNNNNNISGGMNTNNNNNKSSGDGLHNQRNNMVRNNSINNMNNNSNNSANNNNKQQQQMPAKTPSYNNMAAAANANNNNQQRYHNNNNSQQNFAQTSDNRAERVQPQQQSFDQQQQQRTYKHQQRTPSSNPAMDQNEKPQESAADSTAASSSSSSKKYLNLLQRKKSGPALGALSTAEDELTFAPKSSLYLNASSPKTANGATGGAGDAATPTTPAASTATKSNHPLASNNNSGGSGKKSKQIQQQASNSGGAPAVDGAGGKDGAARAQIMALAKEYLVTSSAISWKRITQVAVAKRALSAIMADVMHVGLVEYGEDGWTKTVDLFGNLLAENKWLKKTQFFDAMDLFVEQLSRQQQIREDAEKCLTLLLLRPVKLGALTLDDVLERLSPGRHFPVALDVLEAVQRECGEQWLIEHLHANKNSRFSSGDNLAQAVLPPSELAQGNRRVVELFQNRSLGYLCLDRVVENEVECMLDDCSDEPNKLRALISEKPVEIQKHANFTFILLNKLFARIHNISAEGGNSDKPAQQCKSVISAQLRHYKSLLAQLLKATDIQLLALYALQTLYHSKNFPRGWMLVWFTCLYEEDLVDEPTFWRWREQVNHKYPGKGQALFGLNAWFEYLKNAEMEEEEDATTAAAAAAAEKQKTEKSVSDDKSSIANEAAKNAAAAIVDETSASSTATSAQQAEEDKSAPIADAGQEPPDSSNDNVVDEVGSDGSTNVDSIN